MLLTVCLAIGSFVLAQKMTPATQLLLHGTAPSVVKKSPSALGQTVRVYIHTNNNSAISKIEALGGHVSSSIGDGMLTAELPISQLSAIAELPEVVRIEAGAKVRTRLDEARSASKVDMAHSGSSDAGAFTGKGVVVGIVDTGFEYAHLDFYDSDETTLRVKRIWDQNSTSGSSPEGFGYGTEYTDSADIVAKKYDTTSETHGTHVAGIAAGADKKSSYYGVAPDADLVLVSFQESTVNIADGVKYIFDYAQSVGKPCVVNLSLGLHAGPHDGMSATDQTFDSLTGPGRIIVGAAGNEGSDKLHASKTFSENDTTLQTQVGLYRDEGQRIAYVDAWGSIGSDFKIVGVVVDTSTGNIVAHTDTLSTAEPYSDAYSFSTSTSGMYGTISLATAHDTLNNRPNAVMDVAVSSIKSTRKVGIVIIGREGESVHLWNDYGEAFTAGNMPGWVNGDTDYTTGEIGGTGKSVISVGSYNTKLFYTTLDGFYYGVDTSLTGQLGVVSLFSSHGPTLDGRNKPDVVAPGALLISAISKYNDEFSRFEMSAETNSAVTGQKYYYEANAGTSMSSPVVAGTVALWLQANPMLSPDDVKEIIAQSSFYDKYTARVDNDKNICGAGKLDAYAGLLLALQTNGIKETTAMSESLFQVRADKASHAIRVECADFGTPVNVSIYDLSGQLIAHKSLAPMGGTITLDSLTNGIYMVRMQAGNAQKTMKVAF